MTEIIQFYGADWCSDCRRSKSLLGDLGVEYNYIDLVAVPEAAEQAKAISGRTNIPVIEFPDGSHLVEPSNDALRQKLEELKLVNAQVSL